MARHRRVERLRQLMPKRKDPTPQTVTDEILAQVRDELRSLHADLVPGKTVKASGSKREVTGR
jgi:hypothetical protein